MTDLSKIKAEVGHYSSVVGNSVHLMLDGHMIGQLAILCHTDDLRGKETQTALCEQIVQGFNLDALLAAAVREGMSISTHTATAKFDQATRTFVRDKSADETAIAEAVKRIKAPDA